MTDLATELIAIQQQVRLEIPHGLEWTGQRCRMEREGTSFDAHVGQEDDDCTCDWQARVDVELARRWTASIEAAGRRGHNYGRTGGQGPMIVDVWEAALAAARRKV